MPFEVYFPPEVENWREERLPKADQKEADLCRCGHERGHHTIEREQLEPDEGGYRYWVDGDCICCGCRFFRLQHSN